MEETKHMIQIKNPLYNNIKEYCDLNNLKINVFVNELLEKSFMVEKYGNSPFDNWKQEYNSAEKINKFEEEYMNNPIIEPIPESIQEVKMLDENKEKVIEVSDELKPEFEENIEEISIQPELLYPKPVYTIEDVAKVNQAIVNKPKKRRLK